MLKKIAGVLLILFLGTIFLAFYSKSKQKTIPQIVNSIIQPTPANPFQISYMRNQTYPGSDLKIEETLSDGSNYKRYIASYFSDGIKIYGLLTVPKSNPPGGGFPGIIFNHGYITPEKYTPDGNYIAYVNAFATKGYIVFKPDYRGNGKSEGIPGSTYFSRNYDIDDLNAISSLRKYKQVNADKIGVWGHSMGGHISLMDLEISSDVKAAIVWGGVVGSYNDILYNWQNRVTYQPDAEDLRLRNLGFEDLLKNGTPTQNPDFWNSIDPTANLNFISAPIQIHVGLSDNQVPADFSQSLYDKLKTAGKTAELFTYPGGDHNISQSFNSAMERSISFFDKYLK